MAANMNKRVREPACPLVQGPYRHYILNLLWITINLICVLLTLYHLIKLYRDYSTTSADAVRVATLVTSITSQPSDQLNHQVSRKAAVELDWAREEKVMNADPALVKLYLKRMEREGIARVKMFLVITLAYIIFWGPLFTVTLVHWDWTFEDAKQSMAHEVTLHVALVHSFVNPTLFLVLHRGIRQATVNLVCCSWQSLYGKKTSRSRRHRNYTISSKNRAFGHGNSPGVDEEATEEKGTPAVV